jgi:hypothetical protein
LSLERSGIGDCGLWIVEEDMGEEDFLTANGANLRERRGRGYWLWVICYWGEEGGLNIEHRTSNIEHRTFNIELLTSNF